MAKSKSIQLFAFFFVLLFGGMALSGPPSQAQGEAQVFLPLISYTEPFTPFYVSKLGSNGDGRISDGRSWETAWNELDQIKWNQIAPGDRIYIDGGTVSMTYTTPLIPTASGTADRPIVVQTTGRPGRNGQVVIFGGNGVLLPECGQRTWDDSQLDTAGDSGIILPNQVKHVEINGGKRRGITVNGWKESGIRFLPDVSKNGRNDNPQSITLKNIEVTNNGGVERLNDGSVKNLYYPRHTRPGISLSGSHHLFQYLEIHDNAGDAIQSGYTDPAAGIYNNIDNITIKNSWLYNSRPHSGIDNSPAGEVCNLNDLSGCDELGAPQMSRDYQYYPSLPTNRRESFNWCTHSDGIQIYSSDGLNNLTVQESIIGPNFMNGLILGDNEGVNETAWVNNLVLQDVIITRYMHNALGMNNKGGRTGSNWTIDHVTFYGHFNNLDKDSLQLDLIGGTKGHRVTNSYKIHGRTAFGTDQVTFKNNCEYDLYAGSLGGEIANPFFRRISNKDLFVSDPSDNFDKIFVDNYEPASPVCSSAGSRIYTLNDVFP